MLISLVYVSSASHLMSEEDLLELLQAARKKNQELNITGMLLYHHGNFIQVLEGEEADVMMMEQKIKQDVRHHTMIRLIKEPISERSFPDWSMGFRNIDKLSKEDREGLNDYLDSPWTLEYWSSNPSKAQKLLVNFKAVLR